jgi:endonuclease/exonuclease/phosphatase family metal-dependent hydrolase
LILKHIAETRADKVVVAGDFNSIAPDDHPDFSHLPLSLRLSILLQGGYFFVDAFRELHPHERGFTLPASHPNTRLDYFFVSADLRDSIRACEVVVTPSGVQNASDHLPLRLDL